MIHYDGVLNDAILEEFAGMAARRIAVERYRAQGASWSVARKASLTAVASEELKETIRNSINQGKHPKDAIHAAVKGELK